MSQYQLGWIAQLYDSMLSMEDFSISRNIDTLEAGSEPWHRKAGRPAPKYITPVGQSTPNNVA